MPTSMNSPHAIHSPRPNPTRQARECTNVQLSLNRVIGTTTSSANAFDALTEHHTFVCCAGSAAVLCRVDEHFNITQYSFRARPNASPINAIPSFYNPITPPGTQGKCRYRSPFKDGGSGTTHNGLLDYPPDSPSQGRANNRSRETSCVSLSREGSLMAVGEVKRPASKFATFN